MASSKILQSSYCLQTKMREGNAFTGVCLFTGGGVLTPAPRWVCPEGWAYSPPPTLPTDAWDTTGYGQQAGMMYPFYAYMGYYGISYGQQAGVTHSTGTFCFNFLKKH